ncbi:MAG: RNA polymerase recycling motor HelD [Liquorilactobacillus nagelii]|uniref:RNA polymerase recycling motor HelD n=1 Tax=Liquorilactobacillus nagelii TaxID=82688 RepID=UPI0039E9EAFA
MKNEKRIEQQRVNQVVAKIKNTLTTKTAELQQARTERSAVEKNYGQNAKINTFEIDDQMETNAEVQQQKQLVAKNIQSEDILDQQVKTLNSLSSSPYFGRIDIHEDDEPEAETLYIGNASFADKKNNFLIYDWRAPVSSIYYNGTLGQVAYQTPGGKQTAQLIKKRQFRIKQGQIRQMFDTNETVGDQLLQEMLSEHSTEYMQNIVATIQQEQNTIIRDTKHDLLLVQGVAGSGKTSAALQRIAFLLYHSRENLTAEQMVLFSPNRLFSNYISEVLPSLGENNLRQVTLAEFFSKRFEGLKIENLFNSFEQQVADSNSILTQINQIKQSAEFIRVVRDYAKKLPAESLQFVPLSLAGRTIITQRKIRSLYQATPAAWPANLRYSETKKKLRLLLRNKIQANLNKDWVTDKLQDLSDEQIRSITVGLDNDPVVIEQALRQRLVTESYQPLFQAIYNDYFIDIYKQYSLFLTENDETAADLFNQQLEFHRLTLADCAPLLILRDTLTGSGQNHQIKQLFIDEMQDYTPAQLLYLKHAFPNAHFTLLGDSEQALYTTAQSAKKTLFDLKTALHFKHAQLVELNKSYRSSQEITLFVRQMLPVDESIQPFSRHGARPEWLICDQTNWKERLLQQISNLHTEFTSIAIITQTSKTAMKLQAYLRPQLKTTVLQSNNYKLPSGIIILPVYLAKGLEFDAVIVYDVSELEYPNKHRSILYTACSRAMHRLTLLSIGTPAKLIEQIDPTTFEKKDFTNQLLK